MLAIDNVIVPYDFSPRCRAAAAHAAVLAKRFTATVTLLHVIPYSSFEYAAFEGGSYAGAVWPSEADLLEKLRAELEAIPLPAADKQGWRTEVLKGEPAQLIAEFTAGKGSPLLVMPTHGHGPFRRFVLGSVTAKTLHDVKCPVLTGKHLEDHPPFIDEGYERVVCAVDLSPHSLETLRFASSFANAWGSSLTVVHASTWLAGVQADESMLPPAMRQRLIDNAKGEIVSLLRLIPREAQIRIEFGRAAEVVSQVISETNADILIAGRRNADSGGGFVSHGYELIRSAPCPVLSV